MQKQLLQDSCNISKVQKPVLHNKTRKNNLFINTETIETALGQSFLFICLTRFFAENLLRRRKLK